MTSYKNYSIIIIKDRRANAFLFFRARRNTIVIRRIKKLVREMRQMKKVVQVRMTDRMINELKAIGTNEEKNISEVIREAIETYLEKKGI